MGLINLKKKQNTYYRRYVHFDWKKSFEKWKSKVEDEQWVKSHGFYPFIYFEQKSKRLKFVDETGKKRFEAKIRPIMYAAHIDRFIYKFYGERLNQAYDTYMDEVDLNCVSTAYRSNMQGKSNIHFAKEVFEFIASSGEKKFIYLGDFESFFDKLDHDYLKERIKQVQGVKNLGPADYAIYKNLTRYSWIKMDYILEEIGVKSSAQLRKLKLNRLFDAPEFRKVKRRYIKTNQNKYGIPQGSPISGVYANVYMVEFDQAMTELAKRHGGIYRRYSDDFIIVINSKEEEDDLRVQEIEHKVSETAGLTLSYKKVEKYTYNPEVKEIRNLEGKKKRLNYLGFSLDGQHVYIRDRTLFKYYTRAYRKVAAFNRNKGTQLGNQIRRELLNTYTAIGDHPKKKGNFLTYARRSHEVFSRSDVLVSGIEEQLRNHKRNINKRMVKV